MLVDCLWPSGDGLVLALGARKRTIDLTAVLGTLLTLLQPFVRRVFDIEPLGTFLNVLGAK